MVWEQLGIQATVLGRTLSPDVKRFQPSSAKTKVSKASTVDRSTSCLWLVLTRSKVIWGTSLSPPVSFQVMLTDTSLL